MKWILIKLAAFAGLVITIIFLAKSNISLRERAERNERNVEVLSDSLHHKKVDGLNVAFTGGLYLTPKQFKQTQSGTVLDVKKLGIRVKDVQSVAQVKTVTRDSLVKVFVLRDSVFRYSDKWCSFKTSTKDSSFIYSVRDSLSMIVNRVYRHRFLWWRWGVRGYNVTVINFNPHGNIIYLKYIDVKK